MTIFGRKKNKQTKRKQHQTNKKKTTTKAIPHSHNQGQNKNLWTNGKICAKVPFPRYTESVKFRFQSRETASNRKPYRGLGTR